MTKNKKNNVLPPRKKPTKKKQRLTLNFPEGSKKMRVYVRKLGEEWRVSFSIEQQGFCLDIMDTKAEALLYAKFLRHALKKLKFK